MTKEFFIWDIHWHKVDEYGNVEKNKDGSVKLYTSSKLDYSYINDRFDQDDLEEKLYEIEPIQDWS
tara:strand:+ start:323 stop:520 length:198 start_codon:yes stop_codon:yes gene_type:complete